MQGSIEFLLSRFVANDGLAGITGDGGKRKVGEVRPAWKREQRSPAKLERERRQRQEVLDELPLDGCGLLGGWRFWAGSRSPPSDEVPLSCWVSADLVLVQWRQVVFLPSVSKNTCQRGRDEMLTEPRQSIGDGKESKMSSSQAGLWSDGNPFRFGNSAVTLLRYT